MFEGFEPGADQRQAAAALRQFYLALVKEGFSEDQAMGMISTMLAASLGGR